MSKLSTGKDVRIDACIGACIDACIDVCIDVCIDASLCTPAPLAAMLRASVATTRLARPAAAAAATSGAHPVHGSIAEAVLGIISIRRTAKTVAAHLLKGVWKERADRVWQVAHGLALPTQDPIRLEVKYKPLGD